MRIRNKKTGTNVVPVKNVHSKVALSGSGLACSALTATAAPSPATTAAAAPATSALGSFYLLRGAAHARNQRLNRLFFQIDLNNINSDWH
ncbi:hypothetical protein MCEMSEM23_01309 [Rhabdaerophilaceae bacterium]